MCSNLNEDSKLVYQPSTTNRVLPRRLCYCTGRLNTEAMTKNNYISPKLRTTKNLDWSQPLKTYLKALYGTSLDLSSQVSTFSKLRECVKDHSDTNLSLLKDMYYKYYGQLELLDLRLPIGDGVRVKFTWYDSYDASESHSQHSLAFEKASVLYNLGCVLSQLGAEKTEEEEFKYGYQYFQYAAGVFKFISENFLHAPSEDLSGKTMAFLVPLELAQAQESFLLKVLDENGKVSLISKMAQSCSVFYSTALEKFEPLEEFGESSWSNILQYKAKFYEGLAFYEHALSIEDTKVGEAIVSTKLALESWADCKTLDPIGIDLKGYITLAEQKITTLNKENDLIYHDLLPQKETIEVKPLDAAKAISLNDQKIEQIIGEDIFEKIIPMNVHEKLSYYSEEKAKLLRSQIESNQTCDIELTSFLEYLRLPGSLQEFKNSVNKKLDDRLVTWSQKVASSKFCDPEQNMNTINFKRDTITSLIKQLETRLDGEQDSSASGLRDELMNAKQSLLAASNLDDQIFATIKQEIPNLKILRNSSTLQSSFFNEKNEVSLLDFDDSSSSESVKQSIAKIESNLRVLNAMKTERSKVIEDLKNSIQEDDISNILVLNNKKLNDKEEKELFAQELTKFEPLTNRLESIIFKQPQLIKEIKTNYDSIISSNSEISDRAKRLTSFEKSYSSFQDYEINFQKSIDFYDNLLKFVRDVESNVNKFLADKASQRQLNLSQSSQPPDMLRDRFSKLSVSSQSPRGSFATPPTPTTSQSYAAAPSQVSYQTPQSQTSYQTPPTKTSYQQPQPQVSYQQPIPPSQQQRPSYSLQTSVPSAPEYPSAQPSYPSYNNAPPAQPSYPSYDKPQYAQPQQQASAQSFQQSYQQPYQQPFSNERPALPPKAPTASQGPRVSVPQPPILQDNRFPFYNEPSTFNSGMYDQFANPTGTGSRPSYSQPYDPTKPYNP